MRDAAPDKWVRLHFFADHRWPQTHTDEEQAFARFEMAGNAVFEPLEPVHFVSWCLAPHGDPSRPEDCLWTARKANWSARDWKQVVLSCANDQILSIALISAKRAQALCCYDGGMDLFPESTIDRDQLRSRFAGWLSPHPTGL